MHNKPYHPVNPGTKYFFMCMAVFYLFLTGAHVRAQQTDNSSAILEQAEQKRIPWTQMSMAANLHDASGSNTGGNTYRVLFDGDKTLVGFMTPQTEKGNLLLIIKDELWFYARETRQPTRITPIQRLSGSVSYGDISRLSWTKDYKVVSSEITSVSGNTATTPAYLLHLAANSKGATYQKIDLWVDKNTNKPMSAEVYLVSGKKYKTMTFSKYENIGGTQVNTQIIFTDHFNNNKTTVLDFTRVKKEQSFPSRFFIKSSLPDVSNEICN